MSHRPALALETAPVSDADDARSVTKIRAYDPRYLLVVPLLDHAGSRREDGWRIRVDLSDGRFGFLTFSRRRLWRGPNTIDLGTCDGVHAFIEIDEPHPPRAVTLPT